MGQKTFSCHSPIGIFDSGVGGITVLKALQEVMPQENFLYFGDTKNLPYGDKSPTDIRKFSLKALNVISLHKPKCIILACYTSCSVLEDISHYEGIPVITLLNSLGEAVLSTHPKERLGIWATAATTQSRVQEKILWTMGFLGTLYTLSCPKLAPLIQQGNLEHPTLIETIQSYLQLMRQKNLNGIVYGCTHYPFLDTLIQKHSPDLYRIDPSPFVGKHVHQVLLHKNLLNPSQSPGSVHWHCSGDLTLFREHVRHVYPC